MSSNSFSKKKKTIEIPMPSTFEKHLDVKVIGAFFILLKWQKHLPKQYQPTFASRILPISGWCLKQYG